ncbi:MAG TPA: hypothetical protein VL463_04030 [Kofleriaceae bacterium]|nr:hypothetical protein [Kofleriaceae bacterium]
MKRVLVAIASLAAVGASACSPTARAAIDEDTFTSREADVRMVAPRGWRKSDQPSYPGILLWMIHEKPPGQMLLTVEDIGAPSRACWPKTCGHDATVADFVCVLSTRLKDAGFTVGPVEDGRWFDYQQGKNATRFLRQGVVVLGHHAFTLILAAPTTNDRATNARIFDRALRSVRPLSSPSPEETASSAGAPPPAALIDAGIPDAELPPDGPRLLDGGEVAPAVAPIDAGAPPPDAGVPVVEEVPPCRA